MCSSSLQLAPESRDLSQAEKFIQQDNFECHFLNLLSFTQQLFSSRLEINHVIQQ